MGTVGCGADAAFEQLVQRSQHENRKLRDIAEETVRRYDGGTPSAEEHAAVD